MMSNSSPLDTAEYNHNYSQFYDTLTAHRGYQEDCAHLSSYVRSKGYTDILDFGCGTGSHLQMLSELLSDTRLYGFDLSEHMSNIARSKPGRHQVLDTLTGLETHFDFIYSLYNVINCIPNHTKELYSTLENTVRHLKNRSSILLEMWSLDSVLEDPPIPLERTFDQENIIRQCIPDISQLHSHNLFTLNYYIRNAQNHLFAEDHQKIHLHHLDEILEFLKKHGFKTSYSDSLSLLEAPDSAMDQAGRFIFILGERT